MNDDLGGEAPCWAHLLDDDGSEEPIGRLPSHDPPTHPRLAAAVLMIGVVVFLVAVSLAAVL